MTGRLELGGERIVGKHAQHHARLEVDGRTFEVCHRTPVCQLARDAIAAGVDGAQLVEVWRGGVLVFAARPLSFWAARSVSESDTRSARFERYKPRPEALGHE